MKKILMSILALSAMTTTIYAECASDGACRDVEINRIYMTDYGTIFIGTTGTESNLNCTAPGGGYYLSIRNEDIGKNALYSMVLTAQTTNKKLDISMEAGSADCHILSIALNQ